MRHFRATTWLFALIFIMSGVVGAQPAAATSAVLSAPLATWLATAAPDASFNTIITFNDQSGVSRIDTLNVGAQKLTSLPIAFAALTASQIQNVRAWPEVRSLWHDQQNTFYLDESVRIIGADKVHAGTGLRQPYTGLGQSVAIIDTGVDATHPDLAGHTHMFQTAGDAFDRKGVVVQEMATVDTYGHGTHVASTVAGTGAASAGRYAGVAPSATLYTFKTDAGAVLLDSWALASFDWILSHPEAGIRVSSNSWGSGDGTDYVPDDPVNVTTRIMYDRGITVVFAAGNAGMPNSLNQYATSPWVLSAASSTKPADGSVDRAKVTLSSYSSRGRLGDNWDRRYAQRTNTGIYRPTVAAPGEDIEAARSASGALTSSGVDPDNPFYTTISGTSMATPHVAGTVALMLQARPGLKPSNVISILEGTAFNMPKYEMFEVGAGHLDAYAAVVAAEKGKIVFPPAVNGRTPQFTLTSATAFSGTVLLPDTWQIKECPDTTGLLNHHLFAVPSGLGAVYAEIDWPNIAGQASPALIYLRLYDPNCVVAAESAALLDIGTVWHRAVVVSNPVPGTWTVGVYGRINGPTPYTGSFQTYTKN